MPSCGVLLQTPAALHPVVVPVALPKLIPLLRHSGNSDAAVPPARRHYTVRRTVAFCVTRLGLGLLPQLKVLHVNHFFASTRRPSMVHTSSEVLRARMREFLRRSGAKEHGSPLADESRRRSGSQFADEFDGDQRRFLSHARAAGVESRSPPAPARHGPGANAAPGSVSGVHPDRH